MVLVALLWALCFPLIVTGASAAEPLVFAALRAFLAGGLLVVLAAFAGAWRWPGWRDLGELTLIGLCFTAIGFGGMFLGAGKLASGIATVLANVQPLIAALLAFWCLKETMSGRMLAGLLVGFVGVVVLAFPDLRFNSGHLAGALYVVGGAIGTALGNVLLKRRGGAEGIWLPMGLQLLIGAGLLALASLGLGESWQIRWSWTFASAPFALSIPATALMVVLWYALLARASLTRLNGFTFLTPAFGLLIGTTFLGERFGMVEMAGVAVTLLGIALLFTGGPFKEARI
ncbi:MAG TPA: DMT family transporter [Xanthomonadaceae bacterium]|nr:DMT family transporter [Xanthomonadaceae bacterium]